MTEKPDTVSVPYMIIMLDATHVIVDLSTLSKLCLQNLRVTTQFTHNKNGLCYWVLVILQRVPPVVLHGVPVC